MIETLRFIAVLLCLWGGALGAAESDPITVSDSGIDAYSHPVAGLSATARDRFRDGRVLFRQAWLMPPARDDSDFIGLGPVYNDISCLGCHVKNGRSKAPDNPFEAMHGMLVRVSLGAIGPHGGPNPVPEYGDQLNDHAVPGVPAEGQARITYTEKPVILSDGTQVLLRAPHVALEDLNFGPLGAGAMLSARVAQPVFGLGLLALIPENRILAQVAAVKALGGPVHGHVNRVWNIALHRATLGRFGWKANQPTLAQQAAGAANGDMGLTSPLFPQKNCRPVQTACVQALQTQPIALGPDRLGALTDYLMTLAVPARRDPSASAVLRGQALFAQLGCAQCHHAAWTTGASTEFPALAHQTIHPYTDLALHDMGPGLADGRPDYLASGREWRTAPLWGIGLAQSLNPLAGFLHDGRARTLTEAILWHGGEARAARDAFASRPAPERDDLLAFLNDL